MRHLKQPSSPLCLFGGTCGGTQPFLISVLRLCWKKRAVTCFSEPQRRNILKYKSSFSRVLVCMFFSIWYRNMECCIIMQGHPDVTNINKQGTKAVWVCVCACVSCTLAVIAVGLAKCFLTRRVFVAWPVWSRLFLPAELQGPIPDTHTHTEMYLHFCVCVDYPDPDPTRLI